MDATESLRGAFVGAPAVLRGLSPGGGLTVKGTLMTMSSDTRNQPLPARGYLVNRGITVGEFARSIGHTPGHVSRVLHGRRPVSRSFAVAAAEHLGLSLEEAAFLLGPRETWTDGRWPANP